jgi:transketolase
MLIYSLLHLSGYAHPTIDEIAKFRQLGSPCAGHPENFLIDGIEATTGPLGQGLAMAVGMAIAERHLNAEFGEDLVDHRTWVIAGDGCLMEGINHGDRACRTPEARTHDRAVGRQQNHHRRFDRSFDQ